MVKEKKEVKKTPVKKETSKKKVEKKKTEKKESKLHALKVELSKVRWPEFKEVAKYTIATIVFCLVLVGFFMLLDVISSFVKGLFV